MPGCASLGMPEKNASKAASPPAEAPIPTMGKGVEVSGKGIDVLSGVAVGAGARSREYPGYQERVHFSPPSPKNPTRPGTLSSGYLELLTVSMKAVTFSKGVRGERSHPGAAM